MSYATIINLDKEFLDSDVCPEFKVIHFQKVTFKVMLPLFKHNQSYSRRWNIVWQIVRNRFRDFSRLRSWAELDGFIFEGDGVYGGIFEDEVILEG